MKNQKGITLISLVITIVVLIILAGVAISMTLGENGIFTKAKEAKRMQAIGAAKEQIGLEILEAQIEAMENNEELEQSQVEAIVAKYGELQSDGDTIILNDTEYEVSLREIYNEMAEEEGDETTELAQLKALLAQTTVTEDKILKNFKAYKDGQLITGTMENYAGQTVEATTVTESGENAEITIPQAGYYDTTSKISVPVSQINGNSSNIFDFNEVVTTFNYSSSSVSFTAEIGEIYQVVNYGYQGAQTQDISITSGGSLINKLTDSTNSGCCILWLKATSTTVNLTTSASNNVGCISKCSNTSISGIEELSTLVGLGRNLTSVSIPASTSGYSMFLVCGYQGGQYQAWIPSTMEDMGVIGITSSTGYNSRGLLQWNLKTSKAYNMLGINSNGIYWYAY